MGKTKRAEAAAAPAPKAGPAEVQYPKTEVEDSVGLPDVGDVVYFIDRQRYVQAIEQKRKPVALAAFVTSHNRDKAGELNGLLGLLVLDSELGALPRRDIPMSKELAPNCWTPRAEPGIARIAVGDLVAALTPVINAAVEARIEEIAAPVEESPVTT